MWARVVEIILGFWLLMSPFIFSSDEIGNSGLANYLLCGLLVIVFGILSYRKRTRGAHFLTLIVAFWLIISGYLTGHPAPPSAQNQIIVGILLGMFAIIPNRADEMPEAWEKFYADKKL